MRQAVEEALARTHKLVFPLKIDGRQVFVKRGRPEKNPFGRSAQRLLYRLTGNPILIPTDPPIGNGVAQEADRLRRLAAAGLNVPEVLCETEDYFVMAHTGETVHKYLKRRWDERERFVERTARELRRLHDLGFAHGASQIKNLTLMGDTMYFIDFEENIPPEYVREFQVRDLFLLLHSFERHWHDPDLLRFCQSYGGDDGGETFSRLRGPILGLKAVKLADSTLLRKWRMRDIRSLSNLVGKAAALANNDDAERS